MEKIFKNNMTVVILVIFVVLMMCKPRKSKRVTEKFSSPDNIDEKEFQRLIDEAKNSCNKKCTGPIAEVSDEQGRYRYCPTNNGVTKADYQNYYEKITEENIIDCDSIYKDLHETNELQETKKKLQETNKKLQETKKKLQETDKKLQETDKKLQETDKNVLKNYRLFEKNILYILKRLNKMSPRGDDLEAIIREKYFLVPNWMSHYISRA